MKVFKKIDVYSDFFFIINKTYIMGKSGQPLRKKEKRRKKKKKDGRKNPRLKGSLLGPRRPSQTNR